MRRAPQFALLCLLAAGLAHSARAQQLVDRIVATVEGDVITLSEVRELGAFNRLTGQSQLSDHELLQRLINQWIVVSEATASRFPASSQAQLDIAYNQLVAEFPSPEAYRARLRELGLDDAAVRRQLERQLFLARYLDQKYRFLVRVEQPSVDAYYREVFAPRLQARGEKPPPLDAVREQVREILTQQEITRLAERWLDESRARLRIELRSPEASRP
jgi:hypothetical protein